MISQPDETVLQRVAATAHVTFVDQNGDPTAAGGTVTVDIATIDGSTVATGRATTGGDGTGVYTAALTAVETADLDLLTFTWKDTGTARATTHVEIAGGAYFGLVALGRQEPSIANANKSDTQVRKALDEAIREAERCCAVSWVPRYNYGTVCAASDGTVVLDTPLVRSLRSVADSEGNAVDFTDALLHDTGKVTRLATSGYLTVGWEHGADRPPAPVLAMVARRTRYRLGLSISPDQDRQARFVMQDGQTIGFAHAGAFMTGDDEVDSVYSRFGWRVPGVG
jgi:hypothetical protein